MPMMAPPRLPGFGTLLWVALAASRGDVCRAQADEGSCPAGGGPGCGASQALPAEDFKCIRWRQTGGCSPSGPREKQGDKGCNEEIAPGSSGYCQCGSGSVKRKARQSTCDHRPFKCETECLQVLRYTCVGWRQTGGCSADGNREPARDKPCNATVDARASGFCECGDERVIKKSGCDHGEFSEPFTCAEECGKEADFYEEFGLESSASDKVIKQTFRKLSLKYHPDKTRNDPKLTARFSAVREAYDVLSDPDKRAIYDSSGVRALYDMTQGKAQKGSAVNLEVEVSLEDLYKGDEKKTSFQRKVICRGCAGSSSDMCKKCKVACAKEVEVRNVQMGPFLTQQKVEVPSKQRCRLTVQVLTWEVERGMARGDTLTFPSMGEQQPNKIPGDVVLKIAELKHDVFRRAGLDLHVNMNISLKEALLGFERTLRHLDGRRLEMSTTSITKPSSVMRISGEGMPARGDPTQKGHLYVKLAIVMPEDNALGPEQREWLKLHFPA